ncbi:MAG: WG repeat-containing protein [Clostridia bacterium]|nr:WG repeat-containing protein [Clostridia bacterium]
MKKTFIFVIILLMTILVSCGTNKKTQTTEEIKNSSIDETNSYNDYDDEYGGLDLSEYTSWGTFGEDNLMWVEKSDYKGKSFGYIDRKGNVVISFSDRITTANDFHNGFAVVAYEIDPFGNGPCAIIDTKGIVVTEFITHPSSEVHYLENGNMFFYSINMKNDTDSSSAKEYMFCCGSKTFKGMPYIHRGVTLSCSENLIMIPDPNYGIKYFDTEGNCVIDLESSNQYYKSVRYAEPFIGGQAEITFIGMDDNWYTVKIDKNGEWKNEPKRIDESDAKGF